MIVIGHYSHGFRFWRRLIATISLLFLGSRAHAQRASIGGTVLIDANSKPVANAEILLASLNRSTRSDSAGNFLLAGLPAGNHQLTIRVIGFAAFSANVTIGANDKFEGDFTLQRSATRLDKIEVKAPVSPYMGKLAEFEERRAVGAGKFLTADVFEKEGGRPLSSFIQSRIAGLKVVGYNGERILATTRGGAAPAVAFDPEKKYPKACYVRVVLNGIVQYDGSKGQEMFDVDRWINTATVIGLEFYTVATTPLQYNNTSGTSCGTVIIWTKG